MERLVLALRPHRANWIERLREVGKEATKEIRALRVQIAKTDPELLTSNKGRKDEGD
jgi:hypothetical protein